MTTPQSFYIKATQAELAKNYDEALQYYIKSAQGFLHLSRTTTTDWKKDAAKALDRAEKIKAIKGSSVQLDDSEGLGTEDQSYVLHKSSTINHLPIPLWSDPQHPPIDLYVTPTLLTLLLSYSFL